MDEIDQTDQTDQITQIEPPDQEKLFITAYWTGKNADEPNIGYALRKEYLLYQSISAGFTLLTNLLNWFFEPRVRPVLRPWMRILIPLVPTLILGLLINRSNKHTGYYKLDKDGNPTTFLSNKQPENIAGRMGVNRNRFLEQVTARE